MKRPYQVFATLLAVALATKVGGFFSFPPTGISTFWPPNAILFASVLILNFRDRIFCLGLAAPTYFFAEIWIGFSVLDSAVFSCVNCISVAIGAWIAHRQILSPSAFNRLRDFGVLLICVAIASGLGGLLGSSWVGILGGPFAATAIRWALADFVGYIVFVPFVLTLSHWIQWWRKLTVLSAGEAFVSGCLFVVLALVAYGPLLPISNQFHGTEFIPIPALLWVAVRLGLKGASGAVVVLSVMALGFAVRGIGPFTELSAELNVASLQIFILSLSCAALLVSVLLVERDDAHREVAELDRQNKEARFRTLVDLASDGIMIFDVDQEKFIEANPRSSRIFGYSVQHLLEALGPAMLSPKFQPDGRRSDETSRAYLMEALEGNFPRFEWMHLNASGIEFPCEVSLARYPDPERNLVRASIVDLSERKEAEALRNELEGQLAQAQKLEAVGQLTGGIAHDFNNLLNVILGNLELLKDEIGEDEASKFIDAALRATNRGADLTKNLLNFARRADLSPKSIILSNIVAQMDNWIARTIPANISVERSLADDLWAVEADPSATENALLNLMINARDAINESGTITLETTNTILEGAQDPGVGDDLPPGRYVILAVSDTGKGMSTEDAEHAFEPFFTTKEVGSGSGLGLSMIHGFMRQSKGAARIYTEAGVGTTVKLYFPALIREEIDQDVGGSVEASEEAIIRARVIVAEDQPDVSEVITRILEKEGHEVVAFSNGDEALAHFTKDDAFDLLLTDVVMPGRLQGPKLAKLIRRVRPSIPVIFMSGYAREATIHGNGLRDSDVRLMKPVSKRDLLQAITEVLVTPR